MKRPRLVHFIAIKNDLGISIKSLVALRSQQSPTEEGVFSKFLPKKAPVPIDSFRLLRSDNFEIKIVGLNRKREKIYSKVIETSKYGELNFKIPRTDITKDISVFQIYEISYQKGISLYLGTYFPTTIKDSKKLIICDFDKTLVETKYSTAKEVYNSLTKPLEDFPTLDGSLKIVKEAINNGFHPFVLSASPHFYESAIQDWLSKNGIFTAGIFLKDYRKVFSIFDYELTPKDLKSQGLYKLNHLLDILVMSGIPKELILIGDNFEADPAIYLALSMILDGKFKPWKVWATLKSEDHFILTKGQDAKFLNKIHHLSDLRKRSEAPKVKIFIRKKAQETTINLSDFFKSNENLIELYDGYCAKR